MKKKNKKLDPLSRKESSHTLSIAKLPELPNKTKIVKLKMGDTEDIELPYLHLLMPLLKKGLQSIVLVSFAETKLL